MVPATAHPTKRSIRLVRVVNLVGVVNLVRVVNGGRFSEGEKAGAGLEGRRESHESREGRPSAITDQVGVGPGRPDWGHPLVEFLEADAALGVARPS